MGKRHLFRQGDGRFRQGSLERDFGIKTAICECGAINPYTRKATEPGPFIDPAKFNTWERPTHCSNCKAKLPE
jgi:hypothetical protein